MEFTQEPTVNLPRQRFIGLFDDPENLKEWQTGLVSFEGVTGTPGEPGATSRLTYRQGRGTMEMIKTVTRRDLPEAFDGSYDAKCVHNACRNAFRDPDGSTTRWVAHNVFGFTGFMRILALLFGPMFKKQSFKMMTAFKDFAEARTQVVRPRPGQGRKMVRAVAFPCERGTTARIRRPEGD
ncbi:SRPBCC family protein [Arthrobacter sp. AQ5-05]|uniref:SRPBCC family protein n=1 Tax=Arthrobacter sp. AQ5-05 TaxID=2184581 RepID=UPI000DCCAD7E|nr:SRPBCC family protein [Arthrobacter sp. AQ5-05]RAX48355.1 SRPBCC family protein [Arthrobacter sp. AQ5-05]